MRRNGAGLYVVLVMRPCGKIAGTFSVYIFSIMSQSTHTRFLIDSESRNNKNTLHLIMSLTHTIALALAAGCHIDEEGCFDI